MSLPASPAAAALIASASILFTAKRQNHLNPYNSYSSCKASCQSSAAVTPSDLVPTSSSLSNDSRSKDVLGGSKEMLDQAKTRIEVARRFLELAGRSAVVLADYKLFYYENDPNDFEVKEEYNQLLSKVHKRSATSLYNACVSHGGLLIKMGQYLSNLTGLIPKEYLETLRPLQDSCDPVPIELIQKALHEELSSILSSSSSPLLDIKQIEIKPLGAASLAQVHRATLKDGTVVAIKIQRPGLEASTNADILALSILSKVIDMAFPGAGFEWLLPEFHQSIAAELDFTQEARNMIRCSNMLKGTPLTTQTSFWRDWFWPSFFSRRSYTPARAIVPTPILELSTKKILTMTYEEGFRITDMEKLKQNSLDSQKVSSAACAMFADLTFRHGFVHSDPHPGNILVRPRASSKGEFDIVLLDHGMYRRLEDDFRVHYCNLWAGLVSGNNAQALQGVRGMGLDDKYLDIFAIMLVYRLPLHIGFSMFQSGGGGLNSTDSMFARQRLGSVMDMNSRKTLRKKLEGSFGSDSFSSSSANSFLESLPRDLLFCLRCNNLVRGLNKTLEGSTLGRFVAFGAAASRGSKLNMAKSQDEKLSLSIAEADHFTSSSFEKGNGNDALRRAKELLNRPVASEVQNGITSTTFHSYKYTDAGAKLDSDSVVLPSFSEFLESYKVVLRVWSQSLLLDLFIWYRERQAKDGKSINLG